MESHFEDFISNMISLNRIHCQRGMWKKQKIGGKTVFVGKLAMKIFISLYFKREIAILITIVWIYIFCFDNYCFSSANILFFKPFKKLFKDRVIPSLNLPEKSMQMRIFKPCVTNTSFCSSSGSELFTSSSTQSEEKPKNCWKDFK